MLDILDEEYIKLLKKNFNKFEIGKPPKQIPIPYKEFLDLDGSMLIAGGFSWVSTPQGHQFWSDYIYYGKPIDKEFLDALALALGTTYPPVEVKKQDCF